MKSYKTINFLIFIIVLTINTTNIVVADELVILDTDEKVAEIYLNTEWDCSYTGKNKYGKFGGTSEAIFEQASLKKITGKISSSYCPNGWAEIKGKVKGDTTIFKVRNAPQPCPRGYKVKEKVYKNSEGKYVIKGISRYGDGGVSESICVEF